MVSAPSNFRSEGGLDAFLKAQNIAGLCDVDTREITKHVRERGVMNAMLSDTPELTPDKLARMKRYRVQGAVAAVGGEYAVPPEFAQAKRRVVLWDFGAKQNICRELTKRGCSVGGFCRPTATAQEILALKPDGIMLSNGPGDPAENAEIIARLSTLCTAGIPTFGICLGHQLLALAQGARTEKLKYGHRGANSRRATPRPDGCISPARTTAMRSLQTACRRTRGCGLSMPTTRPARVSTI